MRQPSRSRRPAHRSRRRGGFTLVEVLLVLIILVVIGSIVVPNLFGAKATADINAVKTQISALKGAMRMYFLDMNKYPASLKDLSEEPSGDAAKQWNGPYMEETLKADPWNNEYQYSSQGKHNPGKFDVWSNGPDGQSGTEDDIGNWEA